MPGLPCQDSPARTPSRPQAPVAGALRWGWKLGLPECPSLRQPGTSRYASHGIRLISYDFLR